MPVSYRVASQLVVFRVALSSIELASSLYVRNRMIHFYARFSLLFAIMRTELHCGIQCRRWRRAIATGINVPACVTDRLTHEIRL
jgi:hypothetical protein